MSELSIIFIALASLGILQNVYDWVKKRQNKLTEILWIIASIIWCLLLEQKDNMEHAAHPINKSEKLTEEQISDLKYFWQEKGDIERYCDFEKLSHRYNNSYLN